MSNLRGNVSKYDSICLIESSMSLRYFTTNLSAINQLAGFIEFLSEISVSHGCIFRNVYFTTKDIFKSILEIEEVVSIVKQIHFALVEIHT